MFKGLLQEFDILVRADGHNLPVAERFRAGIVDAVRKVRDAFRNLEAAYDTAAKSGVYSRKGLAELEAKTKREAAKQLRQHLAPYHGLDQQITDTRNRLRREAAKPYSDNPVVEYLAYAEIRQHLKEQKDVLIVKEGNNPPTLNVLQNANVHVIRAIQSSPVPMWPGTLTPAMLEAAETKALGLDNHPHVTELQTLQNTTGSWMNHIDVRIDDDPLVEGN